MPVIKYDKVTLSPVEMDGVRHVLKADVIGPPQGWPDYTLRLFKIKAGGCTPRHQHDWEHVNYVIKGRARLRIGEEVFDLEPKDFALVPPNTEHQFENPFGDDFEFICIVPKRGA